MGATANRVYCGDCLPLLEQLPAGEVDLAFADPPFNIGYEYDVYEDQRAADDYLNWCRRWIGQLHRVLKPDGTFWLAIGDEFAAELKLQAQAAGFHCRSWVIWYYTFGVNCRRGFSRSHTHLFHFVKDPRRFTFNHQNPQIRVKSARELVYADSRANPRGRLPDNTWIIRPQDARESFQADHDTWYYARVAGTFKERMGHHGCQMPEQLLGRIIRATSQPHDLVLDPFGGSGTTLAVAKKLGRRWIGFELSTDYAAAIERRLDAVRVGDALDGPENPLTSAPPTERGKRRRSAADEADFAEQVAAAFADVAAGDTVDDLWCDPERNAEFVAACTARGLAGEATQWNLTLWRLRKSKRLPASGKRLGPAAADDTDAYRHGSEIALRMLEVDYGLPVERLFCSPEFAAEFDALAARFAPGYSPREYRRAALTVCRRARSPQVRRRGEQHREAWSAEAMPQRRPFESWIDADLPPGGVYAIFAGGQTLYVGEAEDLRRRLQQVAQTQAWQRWQPDTFCCWPCPASERTALQMFLAERLRSPLNHLPPKRDEHHRQLQLFA